MYFVTEAPHGLRVVPHQPRRDDRVLAVAEDHNEAFALLQAEQARRDRIRARWQTVRDVALAGLLLLIVAFGNELIGEERIQVRVEHGR